MFEVTRTAISNSRNAVKNKRARKFIVLAIGVSLLSGSSQAGFLDGVMKGLKEDAIKAAKEALQQGDTQSPAQSSPHEPNNGNEHNGDGRTPDSTTAPVSQESGNAGLNKGARSNIGTSTKAPMSDAIFAEKKMPVDTEVRINGIAIQRVLTTPALSAQPVVACDSLYKTPVGADQGRFLIKGYATSAEKPGTSLYPYSNPYTNVFTAYWAKVQHVKVKTDTPWGVKPESCEGWVRVDSMDTYHGGTGTYAHSRLAGWNEASVPSQMASAGGEIKLTKSGQLYRGRYDPRPICAVFKGAMVKVIEKYPDTNPTRARAKVLVINTNTNCTVMNNQVGYIPLNLLEE